MGIPRSRSMQSNATHDLRSRIRRFDGNGITQHDEETWASAAFSPYSKYCEDVIGNRGGENPLSLTLDRFTPASASLYSHISYPGAELSDPDNHIEYWQDYLFHTGNFGEPTGVSDEEFITAAAAATNPSRGAVDVPVFIGELKDVPGLIRNAAQKMSKAGANEYLKYQYGWKPLYSDLKKLIIAVDHIERKFNTLRRLRRDSVLRTRYTPKDPEFVSVDYYVDEGVGSVANQQIVTRVQATTLRKRWAVINWKADRPEGLPRADPELLALAKRAVYGGTVDGKTIWELMPWSWLIDWTTNASEFLGSQRNIVGATVANTLLMKHTIAQSQIYPEFSEIPDYDPLPDATYHSVLLQSTPGKRYYETKERRTDLMPSVQVTGELDLLGKDPFKMSILGALSLQRLRRLPI